MSVLIRPEMSTHDALVYAQAYVERKIHSLKSCLQKDMNVITDALETRGYRRLKFLAASTNSILFETTERQLLRICFKSHLSELELGDRAGPGSVIVKALKEGGYGKHAQRALESMNGESTIAP